MAGDYRDRAMPRLRHPRTLRASLALGASAAVAFLAAGAAPGDAAQAPTLRPLVTGFFLPDRNDPVAFARARGAGARLVRLTVNWKLVAPEGKIRPAGFDATDPNDPAYRWAALDERVKGVVAAGLQPILTLHEAPEWAAPTPRNRGQDGPTRPDPAAYGQFAEAAAKRYSGRTPGLPRVRYWQAWNEPNVSIYLMPQVQGSRNASPEHYRRLVNVFTDAVHRVHRTNVAIAGGLSPFTVRNDAVETVGPLHFLRELLCVSGGAKPRRTCSTRVRFDALAVHPYTSGNPTHEAHNPDDVSLGDLGELRPLLRAAVASGNLRRRTLPPVWITEFSWDSKPPDPAAVPIRLHTRWTAEALYRMWRHGVSHIAWFTLRDEPLATSDFQSGLYYRGATPARDRPKPSLQAFRFPFVAFHTSGGIEVWGRTPTSATATVRIELSTGGRWRELARVRAGRNGVFMARLRSAAKKGFVRAVAGSQKAVPFSLTVPPDLAVAPFGGGRRR